MDESILLNYLRGKCGDEESLQVETWCEETLDNRKILELLYCTLFVSERLAVMDAVDTEVSLEKFKFIVKDKEGRSIQKLQSVRWKHYTSLVAAFLTGIVFVGGIGWGMLSTKFADYTVLTNTGQRAQTVLPDGSKVWLNASTKLVYHNSFWSSERRIDLSGEAYFEVAHDKHVPFIVTANILKLVYLVQNLMCVHVRPNTENAYV